LQWIAEGGSQAGVSASVVTRQRSRERREWIVASLLALIGVAAIAVAVRNSRESPRPRQVVHFLLDFPEGVTVAPFTTPVFSPDGSKIVVVTASGQKSQLWIRNLDSPAPRPLPGTEGVSTLHAPIFSPDSRSLAFLSGRSVRRLDLHSGTSQSLFELPGILAALGAWNREGVILFAENQVIKRVPSSGGAPKPVTDLVGEGISNLADFLPDGRHFLYFSRRQGSFTGAVGAGSIDDPKFRKQILQGTGPARYASPGWLLFSRGGVLLAQRFDADKLELSGEPAPVAEQVNSNPSLNGQGYSVSETGSLA
jgi:WD40 repeat protein